MTEEIYNITIKTMREVYQNMLDNYQPVFYFQRAMYGIYKLSSKLLTEEETEMVHGLWMVLTSKYCKEEKYTEASNKLYGTCEAAKNE